LPAGNVRRAISETIAYRDLDTSLTGILFRDEAQTDPRPGILLLHGGAGLDDHAREQARRHAALGYVVLAAGLLGEGVAGNRERTVARLTAMRDDPALLVRRGQAGLTVPSESLRVSRDRVMFAAKYDVFNA
jgi:dienelactone hydrolase